MKNLTIAALFGLLALSPPSQAADEANIKAYCEEQVDDEAITDADQRAAYIAECIKRNQAASSWGQGSVTGK